jgi:hypothetical protein
MKVDCLFIEAKGPDGKTVMAAEYSECGELFFDQMSEGPNRRVLESGVTKFIDHANEVHQSTGGVIGGKRNERRSACA